MLNSYKLELWYFKKEKKIGNRNFVVCKYIYVVGWLFDGCERGGIFVEF